MLKIAWILLKVEGRRDAQRDVLEFAQRMHSIR